MTIKFTHLPSTLSSIMLVRTSLCLTRWSINFTQPLSRALINFTYLQSNRYKLDFRCLQLFLVNYLQIECFGQDWSVKLKCNLSKALGKIKLCGKTTSTHFTPTNPISIPIIIFRYFHDFYEKSNFRKKLDRINTEHYSR